MNKEELGRRFEAIKRLKQEYYIGTGTALEYLNKSNSLYDFSESIRQNVSRNLSQLENITYPITYNKIIGISDFVYDLGLDLFSFIRTVKGEEDAKKYDKYSLTLANFFKKLRIQNSMGGLDKNLGQKVESFTQVFSEANNKHVTTNPDFAKILGKYLCNGCEDLVKNVKDPEAKELYSAYSRRLFNDIMSEDWDYCFSNEHISNFEKAERALNDAIIINVDGMTQRIFRDQVDHKLEYRRMILTKWLIDNEMENHEQAIDAITTDYSFYKEVFEDSFPNDSESDFLDDSPIEGVMKALNEATNGSFEKNKMTQINYLKRLIFSEKNFIERYLMS